jgi:polysaccharide biosynthesis/export protein
LAWGQSVSDGLGPPGRASMRAFLTLMFLVVLSVGAAAREGVLHAGDSINITVWQDPKLNQTAVIAPDGTFGFPLAGHIRAAGLTPQAVERELRARLQKNYTGRLDITVSLAAANKELLEESIPRVYISGEVLRPGYYPLRPEINIMQALSLAGGMSPFAARQRIQLHRRLRGQDSIFLFNYNAYVAGTDTADNINLRSGDIIIVPERGLFE